MPGVKRMQLISRGRARIIHSHIYGISYNAVSLFFRPLFPCVYGNRHLFSKIVVFHSLSLEKRILSGVDSLQERAAETEKEIEAQSEREREGWEGEKRKEEGKRDHGSPCS